LDIDLIGLDGLTAAEHLHRRQAECRALVLTGLSQPGNLLRALKAHVRGFIVKDAPAETLADGLRRVARNRRMIDPELVAAARLRRLERGCRCPPATVRSLPASARRC
jgi:two-component system response regulator DesR